MLSTRVYVYVYNGNSETNESNLCFNITISLFFTSFESHYIHATLDLSMNITCMSCSINILILTFSYIVFDRLINAQ